jgi:hypothetical protein
VAWKWGDSTSEAREVSRWRGPEAELAASDMKELGELYFVVPKSTSHHTGGR